MSPDDARHGSLNGYNTHNRHGEKACRPCLDARAAERKDLKRTGGKPRSRNWINYTTKGYDPNDGLPEGRWMRGSWGVLEWVEIATPRRARTCVDCGTPISKSATKCRPCNLASRREGAVNLSQLIACPTCGASVNQQCRTTGGHPAASHKARLAPRLCECGARVPANKTMCIPCRDESRRETVRTATARYRERRREDARDRESGSTERF